MIGTFSYLVNKIQSKQWPCVFIAVLVCACAGYPTPVRSGPIHSNNTFVNTTGGNADNNSAAVEKQATYQVIFDTTTTDQHVDATRHSTANDSVTAISPNVTTNNTFNSTDDNYTGVSVSKLNLAIIPGIAVFVFLVVMCLKGCKWFREYTRAEDKDTYDRTYNAIVQVGDMDYDTVETRSETTSNNDTISSYFSFLKRSGNESTLSSFRSMKSDISNDRSSLQALYDKLSSQGVSGNDNIEVSSKLSPLLTDEEKGTVSSAGRGRHTFCTSPGLRPDQTTRTISVSSDETDPSVVSDTEPTTSSKKVQRFKVSFVTETESKAPKPVGTRVSPMFRSIINNVRPNSFIVQAHVEDGMDGVTEKSAAALLKRRYSMNSMRSNQRTLVDETGASTTNDGNQVATHMPPYCRSNSEKINLHSNDIKPELPQTVDVGTQTNKSFRQSLRRGRRKYPSEGGVDENQVPPTIRELTEMCQCKVPNSGEVNGSSPKCRDCDNLMNIDDDVFESTNEAALTSNSTGDNVNESDECIDLNGGHIIINGNSENLHNSDEIEASDNCTNCDLFHTNCDKHGNGQCHTDDARSVQMSRDSVDRPVDMLYVTQDHITSLHNDSNNIEFCSGEILPTKQTTDNTVTGKDSLRKCHSDLEYSHLHSCGCCFSKIQTSSGTFTYDIKYCRHCSLSGCTINEVVRNNECDSLIGRTDASTNRLKRDSSLVSEDLSSSTMSLSSSGYADMSGGSCSSE